MISSSGFAVMAGAGYDAAIMESAAPLKATFGAAAYLMAAVGNIAPTVSSFETLIDGTSVTTDGIAVLLVNFGRIQFDLTITQGWDPRDGLLDVVVVTAKHTAALLPAVFAAVLDRVAGNADRSSGLEVYRAAQVEVHATPDLRMQYDGEVLDEVTPFSARSLPRAATLWCRRVLRSPRSPSCRVALDQVVQNRLPLLGSHHEPVLLHAGMSASHPAASYFALFT